MRSNLNLLSKDEINDLEDFVKSKLKKYDEDVESLFEGLKTGRLKNKKIEVDALDFIQDGLTEIVDLWINENKANSNKEDMVCNPNTRVGKFLKKYNKKQISLEDGIKKLKKSGMLNEVLRSVAHTETKRESFFLGDHDLSHTKRVLLNASMIMNMRNELSDREKSIIFTAIEYHDTGRVHDFEDTHHGERAVQSFSDELNEFSEDEQDLIKFMIIQHCKSNSENQNSINNMDKSEYEKARYKLFLNYLKDADKLDRVRFPEISSFMTDSLDPERLYFDESKQLIKFACESLENSEKLFNLKNDKSKDALFSRKKVFADLEAQDEKVKSVEKFLRENGYPERSKNLKLEKIKPQNSKFIKDGYLYCMRGSRKGQTSGFFTYQYANEKKTVEQYLREHSNVTADVLASRQSMRGRERFISTTTDITVAASFSKLNLEKKQFGSIYVIRVKPEEAYRVISPVGIGEFTGDKNKLECDEEEYLIPDYIRPEEILKEFKYNEYEKIYRYLKEDIGLNIEKADIHLKEDVSKQVELSDEVLNYLCSQNEHDNEYWENSSVAGIGFELLTQIVNNGNGNSTLEKMLNYLMNPDDEFGR